MKKFCGLLVAGWMGVVVGAPVVSNVKVTFDDVARMMTITYDLSEAAIVTVDILKEGVTIGGEKFWDVAGDVNGAVKAGARTISWRPEHLWPEQKFDAAVFTAEVTAWSLDVPPPYLVVWLNEEKGKVRRYARADTIPGGLTNMLYRSERLVMARIPAAGVTWRMGSPEGETGHQANEVQHYVTFTNDFYVGVFPVTAGQAVCVTGGNTPGVGTAYPAVNYSYNAIRGTKGGSPDIDWPNTGTNVAPTSFLGQLRTKTSLAFDIPTEAQFEYAARAGSATAYPNNLACLTTADAVDANLDQIGWYRRNDYQMHPVGLKAPNAWGLYDVCGSIWEWCRDWVGTGTVQAYDSADVTDPVGLTSGTVRSRRGGSYDNVPWAARCAFRTSNEPHEGNRSIAFRLYLPADALVGK